MTSKYSLYHQLFSRRRLSQSCQVRGTERTLRRLLMRLFAMRIGAREGRMLQTRTLASIGIALAAAALIPAATLQAQNSNSPASAYRETLQLYCIGCHSGPTPFAGLNLEPLDFANLEANGEIWEKLIRKLRGRQMPPAGMPRPPAPPYDPLL